MSNKSVFMHDELNWENNKVNLMNEVDNIILSFDLKPYHDLTKPPIKETKAQAEERKPSHTVESMEAIKARGPNIRSTATKSHTRALSQQIPEPLKSELPKLSKTQRRMSLDLMNSRPQFTLPTPGITRSSSLSKPALASTSNVNVLTKPDLTTPNVAPVKTSVPKKFNITLIIPNKKVIQSKNHQDTQSKVMTTTASTRRTSLVGDTLPGYIKAQLNLAGDGKKLSKKQSRLHNLLANSESLYTNNKDITSSKSDTQTGTSDYYNSYENNSSDDDKEYILPNLITKYYGMDQQSGADEDIDFVQINDSFNNLDSENSVILEEAEDEDDEQEDDDEEDEDRAVKMQQQEDDDDYLFKI